MLTFCCFEPIISYKTLYLVQLTHAPPLQCVCLPRPCLSIAEDGGVIATNQCLHQGLHAGLINLILGGRRSKRVVKGEEAV